MQTLRPQGRNVMRFLSDTLAAHLQGLPLPTLVSLGVTTDGGEHAGDADGPGLAYYVPGLSRMDWSCLRRSPVGGFLVFIISMKASKR